ncbi:uncharacterized protein [Neodiprion pinetum]|uniref:Uncharacterized protein LOC107218487 n=1 Tax=Neodiprion lecontei TaxID=441921 RepID=A0A6J0BC70_NEOLC|nr:uncharacterized protein LOC107218487 [Neodiprion lecontei]XP_046491771.1 uncharacterized protein LOC124223621 [Neodiprion pinetum]
MEREERRVRMHRLLVETGNNFTRSARIYRERFTADKQPPSRQSFRRLAETERKFGVLKQPRRQRIRPVLDGPARDAVKNALEKNEIQSMRQVARTLQVPRESIRKSVHLENSASGASWHKICNIRISIKGYGTVTGEYSVSRKMPNSSGECTSLMKSPSQTS